MTLSHGFSTSDVVSRFLLLVTLSHGYSTSDVVSRIFHKRHCLTDFLLVTLSHGFSTCDVVSRIFYQWRCLTDKSTSCVVSRIFLLVTLSHGFSTILATSKAGLIRFGLFFRVVKQGGHTCMSLMLFEHPRLKFHS